MGSESPPTPSFYRHSRLDGGLAYTPASLCWIFSHLTVVELRRMRDELPESPCFGEPFLWTALFRRIAQSGSSPSLNPGIQLIRRRD